MSNATNEMILKHGIIYFKNMTQINYLQIYRSIKTEY